ncbi:hypothetical protein CSOJ01_08392 [Colletotrichum sojae]|uniref:Uncharacterized protein n=1 Tax=Colletotrichum sojae TaxID=2175907 RepID=A0A8H6MT01_9PEZI|nr:hypothetical protein CSOJ01_08392 [Colletotrichum sojae]
MTEAHRGCLTCRQRSSSYTAETKTGKRSFSSGPSERDSRLDDHEPSPPSPVETGLVASGYNDEWLRASWPLQLPVVIRDICQGVGRDNIALRCAVFSLGHLPRNPKSVMGLPSGSNPKLGLTLAILSVQSLIDMKLDAFRRGLASVKQPGEVVAANQAAFCSPGPHRDVMQFWFLVNAWYSIQCPPWDVHARALPAAALKASWGVLRPSTDKAHEMAALLCESRRLYARLSLFRLIESSGITSEDMEN